MESKFTNLGKCPKCGADYVEGMYGPYCTGKCGFRLGKTAFGHELTTKEKKDLLKKKKVLLEGLVSKKTGNKYDMYIKPSGIREFSYTNKAGNVVIGYEYEYETEFPNAFEKNNTEKPGVSPDVEKESSNSDNESEAITDTGDLEEMPFH